MHPNAESIKQFYEAFNRRDARTLVSFYGPEVEFSDPVFPALRGEEVFAMWTMLCERAKDIRIEASGIEADDASGRAHWDAYYTFSKTGRKVENRIDASFVFRGGKIVKHTDSFDLWAWAGMALGAKGKLLGWTPLVKGAIRKEAASNLRAWRERAGAAPGQP